jgi:hypothetical protein
MARSVQISYNLSVKHEPNFLIFLLPSFINKPNLKIWRPRKYALTSIKQLISYELYTLLCAVFFQSKSSSKVNSFFSFEILITL